MPSVTSTSHLLGFRAPVVNAAEVTLPVLVHGELHGLCATHALWREIVGALAAPLGLPNPNLPKLRGGRKLTPEQEAAYHAIHAECAATGRTRAAACRAHQVSYHGFTHWLTTRHRHARAASAPVCKPSGKIL
jgi:hypothetical protein